MDCGNMASSPAVEQAAQSAGKYNRRINSSVRVDGY